MSYERAPDSIEDARRFLIRLWQAMGGKTSDITGWSNNIKPVDSGKAKWCKLGKIIEEQSMRLKTDKLNIVQIENQDALKLIERYNYPYCFIYLDPPYPLETRSKRLYKNEYSRKDHLKLIRAIRRSKAKIMISSYDNELYNKYLSKWNTAVINSTTEFQVKKVEKIWFNYESYTQISMFDSGS